MRESEFLWNGKVVKVIEYGSQRKPKCEHEWTYNGFAIICSKCGELKHSI